MGVEKRVLDKQDIAYLYEQLHEIVRSEKGSREAVRLTRPILGELISSNRIPQKFLRPIEDRPAAYLVYRPADRSFSVISMVWNGGQRFPIHDHLSWGVIGVYRNTIKEQRFDRLDDGSKVGHAEIIETAARDYSQGEILEEGLEYDELHRNDIHRILNDTERPSVSIHILASDLGMRHRNQYDPVAKTVRKFISGYDDPDHPYEGRLISGNNASELLPLEPDEILDTRGEMCPVPANKALEEIEHVAQGKVLQVLTDSEGSAYDEIPEKLNAKGISFAVLEQHEGYWKIKARK